MSNTALFVPIIIDALAKTLLYGPLWSCGLYFASWCILLVVVSSPGGLAWLEGVCSPEELQQLLPQAPAISLPKPSNIIPFRRRREQPAAAEQAREAVE